MTIPTINTTEELRTYLDHWIARLEKKRPMGNREFLDLVDFLKLLKERII
jgi:hypothetical protein